MGGGFTLHPTLLPQVQLGRVKVPQIVRWTFFCAIVFSVQLPTCFFNDFDATWLDIGGQLGSMLELFFVFLPLENCSYLEVVLGAIFL